jgi:phosphoadenosine phosphosulfate reductase
MVPTRILLPTDELVALNLAFESSQPQQMLRWALEDAGLERIAIASAFQAEGTVVMHMATRIRPDVPILFLETGYQFAETLAFKQQLTEMLDLNVVDLVGEYSVDGQERSFGPRLYERDPELCCELNKVRPMFRALEELDLWITAFRRDSSPTRSGSPFIQQYELEPGRFILKLNPMAAWTNRRVLDYLNENGLPRNPLYELGYSSIGCAPCTRVRLPGEPERAGRWAGLSRWECGIHRDETERA